MKAKWQWMVVAGAFAVTGPTGAFAQWGTATSHASSAQVSGLCASFPAISTTTAINPGVTNGQFGTPAIGETYTLSVSGQGTGSFRLVGDPAGAVTYAGPANAPASLSYTVTNATPPVGAQGMGYYFDSGSGTVTITATCAAAAAAASIPANDVFGASLLGTLLALVGGIWLFGSRVRSG